MEEDLRAFCAAVPAGSTPQAPCGLPPPPPLQRLPASSSLPRVPQRRRRWKRQQAQPTCKPPRHTCAPVQPTPRDVPEDSAVEQDGGLKACTTAAQSTLGGHPKRARRRRKGRTGQGMTARSAGKLAQGERPKKLEAQQRQHPHREPPGHVVRPARSKLRNQRRQQSKLEMQQRQHAHHGPPGHEK